MVVHITYVFLTFLVSSATLTPPRRNTRATSEYRLPQDIIPEHYNLEFNIQRDAFEVTRSFGGTVDIKLKVLKETSIIKLNSDWTIKITVITLRSKAKNETILLRKSDFKPDNDTQILTIETVTPLRVGSTYFLYFEYTGKIFTNTKGFFSIEFPFDLKTHKTNAATYFKPANARRVFPCFDEPAFKATFNMKIVHPTEYNALGNTDGVKTSYPNDPSYTVTTFQQTSLMSTYSVAFVLSDFDCDKTPKAAFTYEICSRSATASRRRFALDIGPKILNILEGHTNISYADEHMTKLTQVSIPYFIFNSAENWGLGIFNELNLLYDEGESSSIDQQKVAIEITYQLSHRWFGDLITVDWWSDVFLDEGLAIYSSYFSTQAVLSRWRLDKQYPVVIVLPNLSKDSTQATEPLSLEVSTPEEIEHRFRNFIFEKGSIMIYMAINIMSPETFIRGFQNYVKKNRYSNVKPEDLWNAVGNSASMPEGETLTSIMENWVKKPGYPIVSVSLNDSHIIFSQKRFLTDGTEAKENEKWFIPLTWATAGNKNGFNEILPKGWLTPTDDLAIKNFLGKNEDNWMVVNVRLTGYYRVKYDKNLQNRVDKALFKNNFDGIDDINRAQMVDDYFNMVIAKERTFEEFFKFLKYMNVEDSYFTWYSTFRVFHTMLFRINKKHILEKFAKHILKLMDTVYNTVKDSKDDDHIYILKRTLVLEWACQLGHKGCITMTKEEFKKYIDKNRTPNRNLRFVVYCNGLRYSDHPASEWNKLWEDYDKSQSLRQKRLILSALVCVNDMDVFKGFLSRAINIFSGIRPVDSQVVFSLISTSNALKHEKIDTCLDFLIKNYKSINSFYADEHATLKNVLTNLADRFTNEEQIQRFQDFLEKNKDTLPQDFRTVWKTTIRKAKENLRLTELFESGIANFLDIEQHADRDVENANDVNSALHFEISVTALITILMTVFQRLLF